jgi:ribonuclease G
LARELLIAAGPGEWRAVLLEGGEPVELYVERGDRAEAGSIHLGRVRQLVPALGAALVDIGADRPAFLPQSEIVPRGKPLHEGERIIVQIRREAQAGKAARVTMKDPPALTASAGSWRDVLDRAARLDPPARLYPIATFAAALAAALRATPDRILVDDPAALVETRAAFSSAAVAHLPEAGWPIDLDAVFAEALSETLMLRGGGRAHFEATHAGVMIDIDSGTPETGSPEQTGLTANLAAATVVARQIRLRNLGGGIVVDFVGVDSRASRERVRAALAEALAPDPADPRILGWTRLGHLEVVRPRRGRPLREALLERRPGGAFVQTAVTIAHEALRALRRTSRAQPGRRWHLTVAPEVAAALRGAAAPAVQLAEQRFARKIAIEAEDGRDRERFEIAAL